VVKAEDSSTVIRGSNSKKDKQYNFQKKTDKSATKNYGA
jgi:hypothetical protein